MDEVDLSKTATQGRGSVQGGSAQGTTLTTGHMFYEDSVADVLEICKGFGWELGLD